MEPAVEYVESGPLPLGLDNRSLRRRALQIVVVLVIVALVAAFAPGLGEVRERIEGAQPGWLGVAIVLELLSCLSYVLMIRPIFCARMSWRTSYQLGMSELAVGSLVPASGAAGLGFGAWALRKGGMPGAGHRPPHRGVLRSQERGQLRCCRGRRHRDVVRGRARCLAGIDAAAVRPGNSGHRRRAGDPIRRRTSRLENRAGAALSEGVREAGRVLRRRDWGVIAGSVGYWAFDNAVLWACLHGFGESPPITLVLMGYLIGQLGGLLPIPGGLGGIDGGLLGALVVYGIPATAAAAAIIAYRLILFWLPLVLGGAAFASLRKALHQVERLDLCEASPHPQIAS